MMASTRWGFRSRFIILKSLPSSFDILCSHFSLFIFVIELSFDLCLFFFDNVFCFPNGFANKHTTILEGEGSDGGVEKPPT